MKISFPSLASLLLACWGVCLPLLAQATPPAAAAPRPSGDEMLRTAIETLSRYETIVAKLRQRAELFDRQIVGTGAYLQGPARYQLVRVELNLQMDDKTSTLLQVCDGKQLWTQRNLLGQNKLTCLDAQRVLAAVQKNDAARPRLTTDGLALGGLPRLLRELERSFRFDAPHDSKLGNLPVRVLVGQWQPDFLARLLPDQAKNIQAGKPANLRKLATYAPDQAVIYLGRDDLFPYRIEYRRGALVDGSTPVTLLALEFYEVQVNGAVDPSQFIYQPGAARYTDETDAYLSAHGL